VRLAFGPEFTTLILCTQYSPLGQLLSTFFGFIYLYMSIATIYLRMYLCILLSIFGISGLRVTSILCLLRRLKSLAATGLCVVFVFSCLEIYVIFALLASIAAWRNSGCGPCLLGALNLFSALAGPLCSWYSDGVTPFNRQKLHICISYICVSNHFAPSGPSALPLLCRR